MSKNTGKENSAVAGSEESKGISRRGVVVAAAWAVPVISVGVASPAFAASAGGSLTLTITGSGSRPFGSSLADLTATVRSAGSVAVPGEIVTFSVPEASGAYFGTPGTFTLAVPTGPLGTAVATGLNSGTSTGALVVSAAVVNLASQNQTFTIAAAVNAGTITFDPSTYTASTATTTFGVVSGVVALTSGVRPATVALAYTGTGITGPATATVDATTGAFSATVNHTATAGNGNVVATATGFGTATASLSVTAVPNTGSVAFTGGPYTAVANAFYTTPITGQVTLTSGVYPATVNLTYAAGYTGPATATVNGSGVFTIPANTVKAPLSAASTGVGAISAAAPGFTAGSGSLAVTLAAIRFNVNSACILVSGSTGARFTINMAAGSATLPAGAQFRLTKSGVASIDFTGSGQFGGPTGLSVGVLDTNTAILTTTTDLAAGQTATFTLPPAFISVLTDYKLAYQTTPAIPNSSGKRSADIFLAAEVLGLVVCAITA